MEVYHRFVPCISLPVMRSLSFPSLTGPFWPSSSEVLGFIPLSVNRNNFIFAKIFKLTFNNFPTKTIPRVRGDNKTIFECCDRDNFFFSVCSDQDAFPQQIRFYNSGGAAGWLDLSAAERTRDVLARGDPLSWTRDGFRINLGNSPFFY